MKLPSRIQTKTDKLLFYILPGVISFSIIFGWFIGIVKDIYFFGLIMTLVFIVFIFLISDMFKKKSEKKDLTYLFKEARKIFDYEYIDSELKNRMFTFEGVNKQSYGVVIVNDRENPENFRYLIIPLSSGTGWVMDTISKAQYASLDSAGDFIDMLRRIITPMGVYSEKPGVPSHYYAAKQVVETNKKDERQRERRGEKES